MKSYNVFMIVVMVNIYVLIGFNCLFAQVVDNRPIVVLREDDCRGTWREPFPEFGGLSALEYGKLKRIPITWAVITNYTEDGGHYLSWQELRDYLDVAGGEVASHSVTHSSLSSPEAYIDELIRSKNIIEQRLQSYACTTFLQPGVWHDYAFLDIFTELENPVGQAIQTNYEQSMAYLGAGWAIGTVYYRYGLTNTFSIDCQSCDSIDAVLATLDVVAATPGLIFVVSCHGVQSTGAGIHYCVSANLLKAFMDKLAELRDAGEIRLMSLRDAYNTTFSENLNCVPDGSFEVSQPGPLNPRGPWNAIGNAEIVETCGVDNSRYAKVSGVGARLNCGPLNVGPGRYELSWYQRAEPGCNLLLPLGFWGYISSGWKAGLTRSLGGPTDARNNLHGVWERKSILILVEECYSTISFNFCGCDGISYGIDNVALLPVPVDPSVSATDVVVKPIPGECSVEWQVPNRQDVTNVVIRYSPTTFPQTPDEGLLLGSVSATPNTRQEMFVDNFDWTRYDDFFFSIFVLDDFAEYAPCAIAQVKVDKTVPSAPEVIVNIQQNSSIQASWTSLDSESAIAGYSYCVGSQYGSSDLVHWTNTKEMQVSVNNLPAGVPLYLSVKAQNIFGFWSPVSTASSELPDLSSSIRSALNLPDMSSITVAGIITAIFSDGYYIEQEDRLSGIKILGTTTVGENNSTVVSGTLATIDGQRVVIAE